MSTECLRRRWMGGGEGERERRVLSIVDDGLSVLPDAKKCVADASARGRASGWSRRDHGKQSKLNLKLLDILFVRLLYVA